jgi:small subunit ribosomal protein S1
LASTDTEADAMLTQAFGRKIAGGDEAQYMDSFLGDQIKDLSAGKLITGKVVGFAGEDIVVEVGLKSEGLIPKDEFEGAEIKIGDTFDVLLEKHGG